jgi:hypothetical protein
MNVPFPPVLLWPVVIGMVVGAFLWRRLQNRAILLAPPQDWPKHAPTGWRHWRTLPVLLAVAGLIIAYSLWRFSAPCVYGLVVDATTGEPVAGAQVLRTIFRMGPPSLAESGTVNGEPFSSWRTHTGKGGRFFLPGFVSVVPIGIAGTSGITWVVYRPGLMPAEGCLSKGFASDAGCGVGSGFTSPDPWVLQSAVRHLGAFHLDVKIYPPTLKGVTFRSFTDRGAIVPIATPPDADPWGQYFRRLNLLVQSRYLSEEQFVKEAEAYAANHDLNWNVITPLAGIRGLLGYRTGGGKFYKPDLALKLLELEERFCQQHKADKRCDPVSFDRWQRVYAEEIEENER